MAPRVLMVRPEAGAPAVPELAEIASAAVVVPDGEAALARLRAEPFDAVLVDLTRPPLDGWCVLAAAGALAPRPSIVALVGDRAGDVARARLLGADRCVTAGTRPGARALVRSTKEIPWPAPRRTSSLRPTTAGVSD